EIILEAIENFQYLQEYRNDHTAPATKVTDSKQLLMVYHRLPFDIELEDGQPKRIPPRSPNGIIPSLLGFFSNGRPGIWVGEEAAGLLGDNPSLNPHIDREKYPNLRRSEEHTSELQSRENLVCRLLLEKKNY